MSDTPNTDAFRDKFREMIRNQPPTRKEFDDLIGAVAEIAEWMDRISKFHSGVLIDIIRGNTAALLATPAIGASFVAVTEFSPLDIFGRLSGASAEEVVEKATEFARQDGYENKDEMETYLARNRQVRENILKAARSTWPPASAEEKEFSTRVDTLIGEVEESEAAKESAEP